MPYMKASERYCIRMPNKWNFSVDYFYASVLLTGLYIPGFPYLFLYGFICSPDGRFCQRQKLHNYSA
uniref:very-long-chain (3R)-3-hydroxyacyl-CoA dehydratase n=1 Tax=Arundo donax TaxID=35708 RepID=A0A0A9GAF0_ARUDO